MKAISLFACGGIGDLALRHTGIDVLVANELIPERAEVFKYNYPATHMIVGDVWQEKSAIVTRARQLAGNNGIDLVFATPPCQGMSKNGRGKLLNSIRKGEKPPVDPRNLLVIPTIEIFLATEAHTLVMENVPEMGNTFIPDPRDNSQFVGILDYIKREIGDRFYSCIEVVEFADYGIPQSRERLISIFTKNDKLATFFKVNRTLLPPKTHCRGGGALPKWKTLRDAIGGTPSLDAGSPESAVDLNVPFHSVPLLDEEKYFWVSNTPAERGAFDNQCINPECLFQGNPIHVAAKDAEGVNRASTDTPIHCVKCGELLPRPWVRDGETYRLMKGYTSAYRRMRWGMPAPTLTRNLSYACSDNKLHPTQHRVLSLHEAMILHTVADYEFFWKRNDGKNISDKIIRELIGESIPPAGLEQIFQHIKLIVEGKLEPKTGQEKDEQLALF